VRAHERRTAAAEKIRDMAVRLVGKSPRSAKETCCTAAIAEGGSPQSRKKGSGYHALVGSPPHNRGSSIDTVERVYESESRKKRQGTTPEGARRGSPVKKMGWRTKKKKSVRKGQKALPRLQSAGGHYLSRSNPRKVKGFLRKRGGQRKRELLLGDGYYLALKEKRGRCKGLHRDPAKLGPA